MTRRQATLALVVITLLWGMNITAIKVLFAFASPMVALAIRYLIAGLILAPSLRGLQRHELRAGALVGGLFTLGAVLQNHGLAVTTASRQAFLLALAAVLTPGIAAVALGHSVDRAVFTRILAAMIGVYLLTSPGGHFAALNLGDVLTLASALCYAGQIVAIGHYARGVSAARLLSIQFLTTGVVALAASPLLETAHFEPAPIVGLLLVYLVITTLTTFGLQIRAQRVVSSSEAALVFTFEPVVTATTSWVLLGETLSRGQWAGALVIMLAVGWPGRDRKQEA